MSELTSPSIHPLDAALARLHFELPPERIAQDGAEPRDHSRLLVAAPEGQSVKLVHGHFYDLPQWLRPGDVLVFNQSKVIPARILAHKEKLGVHGGGQVEVMLLQEHSPLEWSAYLKPARRVAVGQRLLMGPQNLGAEVVGVLEDGARLLRFDEDVRPHLDEIGRLPLPPYIAAGDSDERWRERYQTVYAHDEAKGSVAAPTAGLHFTPELLAHLSSMGVEQAAVTLHVGAGTFKPIKGLVSEHQMHAERYEVSPQAAHIINRARSEGRRIVAVGTTTVRTLESAWDGTQIHSGAGETQIFITPGQAVMVPDLLITNFHLPESTLLLLVAAFAGEDCVRAVYQAALEEGYRFYSLGDATLLFNSRR